MKKIIIIMLFNLSLVFAQVNQKTNLVSSENLTLNLVKKIFDNAYFDTKIKGTHIKIKDTWTINIDIDSKKRFITFYSYWQLDPKVTELKKLKLINQINKDVLIVSPYINDKQDAMMVKYDLWLEGGVTPKNIIRTEKIFYKALSLILKKDITKIIK